MAIYATRTTRMMYNTAGITY